MGRNIGNPEKVGTTGYISYKDLVNKIAETSEYHKYEIEDIMRHLIAHMQHELSQGVAIKIDGIGWFSRRVVKPRKFRDLAGVYRRSFTAPSVTLKPDGRMKSAMRISFPEYVKLLTELGHIPEGYDQEEDVDVAKRFRDTKGVYRKQED